MNEFILSSLQIVVALGLLNVWIVRSRKSTPYRGGKSNSLKEEFSEYGLPNWFYYAVGSLKISAATMLLLGLFVPQLVYPASVIIMALMLGAVAMHVKIKDPLIKVIPASTMLIMTTIIYFSSVS